MLELIEAILISIAAYGIALSIEIFRITFIEIYKRTNFKPLNCRICLTFWSALILTLLLDHDLFKSIIYGFFSVSIASILKMLEENNYENN